MVRIILLVVAAHAEAVTKQKVKHDHQLFGQLHQLRRERIIRRWPKGLDVERPSLSQLAQVQYFNDSAQVAAIGPEQKFQLRHSHAAICGWISRHHPMHQDLCQVLIHRAVRKLALWPSEWQRPVAYHEGLGVASPLHQKADIQQRWPALAHALETFQASCLQAFTEDNARFATSVMSVGSEVQEMVNEHPEGLHMTGMWTVTYLMRDEHKCERDVFPQSCSLLLAFDRSLRKAGQGFVQAARLATLYPGTKVVSHTANTNQRLKVHCGLQNPGGVELSIASLSLKWESGVCELIDDSFEHKIESNHSQQARTILELKLEHPDLQASGYILDEESGRRVRLASESMLHSATRFSEGQIGLEDWCEACEAIDLVYMSQRLVARDPYNSHAWNSLGIWLAHLGNSAAAPCFSIAQRLLDQQGLLGTEAAHGNQAKEKIVWSDAGQLIMAVNAALRGPGDRQLLADEAVERLVIYLLGDTLYSRTDGRVSTEILLSGL